MPDLIAFEEQTAAVGVSLPALSFDVVLANIVETAREVCERTGVWRYVWGARPDGEATVEFEPEDAAIYGKFPPTGDAAVDYNVGAIADVDTIRAVRTREGDSVELRQISKERLFSEFPQVSLDFGRIDGQPQYYYIDEDKSGLLLYFVPWPGPPLTVRVETTLKPKSTAAVMDARVWGLIRQAVMHGALQRTMTIPDAASTDLELAAYHARQFVFELDRLRSSVDLGVGRQSMQVQPRPWLRNRRGGW